MTPQTTISVARKLSRAFHFIPGRRSSRQLPTKSRFPPFYSLYDNAKATRTHAINYHPSYTSRGHYERTYDRYASIQYARTRSCRARDRPRENAVARFIRSVTYDGAKRARRRPSRPPIPVVVPVRPRGLSRPIPSARPIPSSPPPALLSGRAADPSPSPSPRGRRLSRSPEAPRRTR